MDDAWLTLQEAAARIGVRSDALRHAIRRNALHAEKIETPRGPYYRVTVAEIDQYAANRKTWKAKSQARTEDQS